MPVDKSREPALAVEILERITKEMELGTVDDYQVVRASVLSVLEEVADLADQMFQPRTG